MSAPADSAEGRWLARLRERRREGALHVAALEDVEALIAERNEARAEVERLRSIIQEWSYPRLYVQPGVERETLLAQLQENLVNKVRPSIEAAEERGAKWALEIALDPSRWPVSKWTPEEVCRDARRER